MLDRALTVIAAGLLVGAGPAAAGGSAGAATTCTRHVAVTGSDTASGSATAPWATLAKGLTSVTAGDVLCVHAGRYAAPQVTLPPGTSTAPITLEPAGDGPVVVIGATSLRRPEHWVLRGLEWTNPGGSKAIVTLAGGTGWTFEGNHLYDGGYAGLLVGRSSTYGSPHRYTIRANVIHATSASNLYHNPGRESRGGLIERNLLFDAGSQNLKLGWGGTDACTGTNYDSFGIGEVVVRYNTMHGAPQPLAVAEAGGDLPVLVHRNLVSGPLRTHPVRIGNVEGCLRDNVSVVDNLAHGGTTFLEDFDDAPSIVAKAVDNVWPRDPAYDSTTSPDGFRPQDPVAQGYGRYAGTASEPTSEPTSERTSERTTDSSSPSPASTRPGTGGGGGSGGGKGRKT